ncbi:MAG: hypothetical protein AB4290_13740 [Spirulina sp.]
MSHKLQPIPLWVQWILATSLSLPLGWSGWGLLAFIPPEWGSPTAMGILIWVILPILTFLPLGLMQWAVLRRRIHRGVWWIPATVVGSILGLFCAFWSLSLFVFWTGTFSDVLGLPIATFVGGAIVGLLQWFVLRPYSKKAYWWILASGVGWMCSVSWFMLYTMGFIFSRFNNLGDIGSWLVLASASGGMGGMIKGIALAWILAVPPKHDRVG